MNRLWAPWRKAYIRPNIKKTAGCLFCGVLAEKKDKRNLLLIRSRHAFALLNKYPYNNGHLMVIPNRHVSTLDVLKAEEKLDLLALTDRMIAALKKSMKPHGFNVGINLGKAAGAGIPKHIHLHIVPRWSGDSNFMPVVGKTKVISEALESAYLELTRILKKMPLKKSKR